MQNYPVDLIPRRKKENNKKEKIIENYLSQQVPLRMGLQINKDKFPHTNKQIVTRSSIFKLPLVKIWEIYITISIINIQPTHKVIKFFRKLRKQILISC